MRSSGAEKRAVEGERVQCRLHWVAMCSASCQGDGLVRGGKENGMGAYLVVQTLRYLYEVADLFCDSLVSSAEDVEWCAGRGAVGGGLMVVFGHDDLEGWWDDGFEYHRGGGVDCHV